MDLIRGFSQYPVFKYKSAHSENPNKKSCYFLPLKVPVADNCLHNWMMNFLWRRLGGIPGRHFLLNR